MGGLPLFVNGLGFLNLNMRSLWKPGKGLGKVKTLLVTLVSFCVSLPVPSHPPLPQASLPPMLPGTLAFLTQSLL